MKITLKTLPQATEQEVFDQVVEHLLKQKKKSRKLVDGIDQCLYRHGELSCAAGCLIADDEYKPWMERKSWAGLTVEKLVPADHGALIFKLQFCHDQVDVEDWPVRLRRIAEENCLKWKFDTEEERGS